MGTDFWNNEIAKEMANVRISLEKLDGVTPNDTNKGEIRPIYDHINVHMVFYINMDGKFTRKVILVTDGHTIAPKSLNT